MQPPRPGRAMGRRFALGGLIVVLLTVAGCVGVWITILNGELGDRRPAPLPGPVPILADVAPDKPQSILVLGTDRRYGDQKAGLPIRSDTMMVVHLDPDRGTAVMSLPRDLVVPIPGHGRGRINGAYATGGAKLAVETVNGMGFDVSHVVGVNFGGFRRAVNRLGCVYVDVDRRYFNDNDPPVASAENYATIDLKPGYQRLCGQDALDFVRFRHLDDDFVRASRQQGFLRQAKGQVAVTQAIRDRDALLKIFADYSESDLARASAKLPVFYPRTRLSGGGYARDGPRAYDIEHNGGGSHRAYRIVLEQGDSGQYYGVQGTTWRSPPILKGPRTTRRMGGRAYSVYSEGGRIRIVAWRTSRAVYWVSNTLSGRLSNAQMLALARSLVRVGR